MKQLALALLLCSSFAYAQRHAISVGPAKLRDSVLSITPIRAGGTLQHSAQSIQAKVEANLKWMQMFRFSASNPDFRISAELAGAGDSGSLTATIQDGRTGKTLLSRRYQFGAGTTVDLLARKYASDIVQAITGFPGVFESRIAMTCERGAKEVYVMDFDGSNVMRITQFNSTAISPAWSPDNTRLAYTVTAKNSRNVKVWQLREFDFSNNTDRLLSDRPGMNSGAAYSPDGRWIAFTTGFFGNPELVLLDPSSRTFQRLTNDPGEDVDPAWSPNGREMAFVSSRGGRAMIYKMSPFGGGSTSRLTFAGNYNASPAWSPQGDKIAFASWQGGRPDIYVMTAGGAAIERLTKGEGSNEDPTFSPDGNFIAFSSNRAGHERSIYVMNADGTAVRRLTLGIGNCSAPKWSRR